MTPAEAYQSLRDRYSPFCNGDEDALQFLMFWHGYCHDVDDIIDWPKEGKTVSPEFVLATFAKAAALYSLPFYQRYAQTLFPVVLLVTNAYADSVAWEHDPLYKRQYMADVLRHCGNEMITMICYITGGWQKTRALSATLWERSYDDHHHPDNTPK